MNLYPFRVTCHICGGEGVGSPKTAAAEWIAGKEIIHIDPRVCRDNLAAQRERDECVRKASGT